MRLDSHVMPSFTKSYAREMRNQRLPMRGWRKQEDSVVECAENCTSDYFRNGKGAWTLCTLHGQRKGVQKERGQYQPKVPLKLFSPTSHCYLKKLNY